MARKRDRTFTGCWKCRARKVKCDETKPCCLACGRIGVKCSGYDVKFIWVEDDGSVGMSQGRRVLPCESTWKGFEVLPMDLVDLLISLCDEVSGLDQCMSTTFSTSSCEMTSHSPFSVLRFETQTQQPYQKLLEPDGPEESSISVLPMMTIFPDWSMCEKFLFHHYVSHVAIIMMPYEHPRNPWKSHYPAVALELASLRQGFLHSAMIAHAAFNVGRLRGNDIGFLRLGMKHYGNAIQSLVHTIGSEGIDFPATMASIMTLMFAELYNGPSRSWRHHFDGAWTLLEKHCKSEPWKSTDLACVSLQSLSIIKIIGDTSKSGQLLEQGEYHPPSMATGFTTVSPILSTCGFGFTIGAPRAILCCIARITEFRKKRNYGHIEEDNVDELLAEELSLLSRYRKEHDLDYNFDNEVSILESDEIIVPDVTNQKRAFVQATYIYLYRSLLSVPPEAVKSHVRKTFMHVSAFFANSNGNFSIWPAFIAAVEAFTEDDLTAARAWLDSATSFGIGSRDSMKMVIEEVWRRREAISRSSGLEPGMVAIDWRDVMQELDCDVLLI